MSKELPSWAMPAAIAAGILILVVIAWRSFTGFAGAAPGPPKETKPAMYDFRKEAAAGRLGQREGGSISRGGMGGEGGEGGGK